MPERDAPDPAAAPAPRPPVLPAISARCTGCGRCVAACPPRVLWLETDAHWVKAAVLHDAAACTGCARCVPVCPYGAITMRRAGPGGAGRHRAAPRTMGG